jgi:tetratricopeptide (TPR) repeat protein
MSHAHLGRLLSADGKAPEATAEHRQALDLMDKVPPASQPARRDNLRALVQNGFAWHLVTCPDLRARDPIQALDLARKALVHIPQFSFAWKTLGVAHYRAGDWKAAIEALEKAASMPLGADGEGGFFLAMAYWQAGEKAQARASYGKAVAWLEKFKSPREEQRRARAEAANLLGIADEPERIPPPRPAPGDQGPG